MQTRPILEPVSAHGPGNCFCTAEVAHAGLLIDAADYYRALHHAARAAEHYILLCGWQFDSEVRLLRGREAHASALPSTLKSWLDALCAKKPKLRVYMLAWDFHMVFALEREWLQPLIFELTTSERLRFRFDDNHVRSGSHHQKFVVIDGELSFLGGVDVAEHRWDDRCHLEHDPRRTSHGAEHKPFHDVQLCLRSREVSRVLTRVFCERWQLAGGEPIMPDASDEKTRVALPDEAFPIPAQHVALSRTDPQKGKDQPGGCREIFSLYAGAIERAERSIYLEMQYFSSHEICEVLVRRLRDRRAPPLSIVMVLNMEADSFKEEVAVGLAQAEVLAALREAAAAAEREHELGLYYTVPLGEPGREPLRSTYIHSKLMIVDDRFLTIGSANLTNRSLNVDTELQASFETLDPEDALGRSIASVRRTLLAEHLGVTHLRELEDRVPALDALAVAREGRLRIHPAPSERERALLRVVDPQKLPFDPDGVPKEPRPSILAQSLRAWRRLRPSRRAGS